MLAAGIKTPVPLEELEIHLREEIERQTKSGLHEQQAFETAVSQIGQGSALKTEFVIAGGLLGLLGENKPTRINRILGALWTAQCLWFLSKLLPVLGRVWLYQQTLITSGFFLLVFGVIMYLSGVFGGVYLFRGAKLGRRIIRIIALLGVVACVAQILRFRSLSAWGIALTVFNLITIRLLHTTQKQKLATK